MGEPLTRHTSGVSSVAYSPDGPNVVSGSDDNTIRIWDAQAGLAEGDSILHTSMTNVISFLADGRSAFSDSTNPSNNRFTLNSFSGHPIPKILLHSNGWVCSDDGPLFWVPEDCRRGLTCPAVLTIPNTGRQKCVRIDFTQFQYGTSWTNIRGGNRGGES